MKYPYLTKPLSALFLLSGCVFAQDQTDQTDQMNPSDQTDQQMNQPMGIMPQREITPSANPRIDEGAIIVLSADFIYWNPREDGLAFASTGLSLSGDPLTDPIAVEGNGKVFEPKFEWLPGLKAGLGLESSHDGWDAYANYTWLRRPENRVRTAANVNASNMVEQLGLAFENHLVVPVLQNASGSWRLMEFNVVDAEIGRRFFISQYLVLRPSFGLKGTWQRQVYDVTYAGVDDTAAAPFPSVIGTIHQNMRNWGIGIRSGLNTNWHLSKVWSLYGNAFLTGLWSGFEVSRVDTQTNEDSSGILWNTKHRIRTILPVVELAIGLQWENWFWHDSAHLSLSAGWEQQIWVSMNQFINRITPSNNGNLVMQGLDVKLRFDF